MSSLCIAPRNAEGHKSSFERQVWAYADKMPQGHFFSHLSAARLWGIPLPPEGTGVPVHVSVLSPHPRPRAAGVTGHELDPRVSGIVERDGLRLSDPESTWCQLSGLVSLPDLVAAADWLVTEHGGGRPLSNRERLEKAAEARRGHRGASQLREALELVRVGPQRRLDSVVRVILVQSGLPEPTVNLQIVEGGFSTSFPLGYPEQRLGIDVVAEAERPFLKHTELHNRERQLDELGWKLVTLSDADVHPSQPAAARAAAHKVHSLLVAQGRTA